MFRQDFIIIYILTSECHTAYLCLVQTTQKLPE